MKRFTATTTVIAMTTVMLLGTRSLSAQPITTRTTPEPTVQLHRAQQRVFRAATDKIAPSIVMIETVGGTQPATDADFIIAEGPTTGIVYSADGLILTSSFNFIRDPSVITVVLADGRRFVAELLARDEVRKLAMLEIDADSLPVPEWMTQSKTLRVGQWTIAAGRGFGGDEPMISVGIISAMNRQSGLAVQTDAKLSPANYGGPLIDVDGKVIGICVPMGLGTGESAGVQLYDSGLGFAIPFEQVKRSASDLADGHSLRHGLLGIAISQKIRDAIMVAGVADPSPAMKAGMREGDQIIAIDGTPVKAQPDLRLVMAPMVAGQAVKVKVIRGDETLEIEIVLAVPEDLGKIKQDAATEIPEAP